MNLFGEQTCWKKVPTSVFPSHNSHVLALHWVWTSWSLVVTFPRGNVSPNCSCLQISHQCMSSTSSWPGWIMSLHLVYVFNNSCFPFRLSVLWCSRFLIANEDTDPPSASARLPRPGESLLITLENLPNLKEFNTTKTKLPVNSGASGSACHNPAG